MAEASNVERVNPDIGETYLNVVARTIEIGLTNNRSEAIRNGIAGSSFNSTSPPILSI
ncbi:MAG TPA: hypothetical protein VK436_17225 [Methanocella sp.]|nr:hypothetical protein [Methanocella sp.]